MWLAPALTEVNVPLGEVAAPKNSWPQQTTSPSVFTPQVWNIPTLTEVNVPAGVVVCPTALP